MTGVSDTNLTVIQAVVLANTIEIRERASECELETLIDRETQTGTNIVEIRRPDSPQLYMVRNVVMTLAAITGSLQEVSPILDPQRRINERAILSLPSQNLASRWLRRPSVCPRPKIIWRWMRSSLMS